MRCSRRANTGSRAHGAGSADQLIVIGEAQLVPLELVLLELVRIRIGQPIERWLEQLRLDCG